MFTYKQFTYSTKIVVIYAQKMYTSLNTQTHFHSVAGIHTHSHTHTLTHTYSL